MAQEETVRMKLVADTKDATKKLEKVKKDTKETGNAALDAAKDFSVFGVSINSITKGFGKVIPIAKSMFTTIKAGLMSTGIGAIVVAVGSLITYFTQTQRGADKLSQVFKGLGAAISVIVDRISSYAEIYISIFKGDLSGAVDAAKKTFSGLGDEIAREVSLAVELEKATQKLRDTTREINVETAQRRAEIEGLKLIAEDVTKTEQERMKAAQDAFAIEQELMNKRVAAAEEDVRIAKERISMGEAMAEDLDDLAEKEIRLADIRGESLGKSIELNNKINSIEAEAAAKREARHQENLARLEEEKQKRLEVLNADLALAKQGRDIREEILLEGIENAEDREIKGLELKMQRQMEEVDRSKASEERKNILQLEILRQHMVKRKKIRDKFDAAEDAEDKKNAQEKIDLEQTITTAKQDLAMNALGQLSAIAGKESAIGKAAAIAETIINTHKSATAAYASMSAIPIVGPALGAIAAGLAVTAGMASVQKIASTPPPNTSAGMATGGMVGGTGSGTSDSVNTRLSRGESVINAKSTRMFKPLLSAINQAGGGRGFDGTMDEGSGGMTTGVVKAFVVSDDITNQQDKLTKIRRKATI